MRWLLATFILAGCSGSDPAAGRRAWLVDALLQDNQIWLQHPDLLAEKYAAMAEDRYDFMRGTAAVFYLDLARRVPDRATTEALTERDAAELLVVGDPHPENFGMFLPGPGPGPTVADPETETDDLRIELNDIDGATFGPWVTDLRRAALGVGALIADLEGCAETCRGEVVAALVRGYAEEALGAPHDPTDRTEWGALVRSAMVGADEEGRERAKLERYAPVVAGERVLGTDGDRMVGLRPHELAQLDRLWAAYEPRVGLRRLDGVRRYGTGVASMPALRFVVLADGGDAGPEDDRLLTIREVVEAPAIPGLRPAFVGLFEDNADRLEAASRRLWSVRDADAQLAGLMDGGQAFKVLSWSSFFQGFDHMTIAESWRDGDVDQADLELLAARLGAVLAASHARGGLSDGGDSGAAIRADLDGRVETIIAERVRDSETDLQTLITDHGLFVSALADLGPVLGADRTFDLESR